MEKSNKVRIDIFRIATRPEFSDSAWKVSPRTKISLSQVYPVSHGSWSKFDRWGPFWHTWLQVLKLHYLVTPWSFFKNSKTSVLAVEQALSGYTFVGYIIILHLKFWHYKNMEILKRQVFIKITVFHDGMVSGGSYYMVTFTEYWCSFG